MIFENSNSFTLKLVLLKCFLKRTVVKITVQLDLRVVSYPESLIFVISSLTIPAAPGTMEVNNGRAESSGTILFSCLLSLPETHHDKLEQIRALI